MRRPILALFLALGASLAVLGVIADRALVREMAASKALAAARAEPDVRAAALSVRGMLGQIEKEVLARSPRAGVSLATLAIPPEPTVLANRPYRRLGRAELIALLTSRRATAGGLPEAVVASIALGEASSHREVAERLLEGQLPVRPEDLPFLARSMGVDGDPRVDGLQRRLREVPAAHDLPAAPAFRRGLSRGGILEGWSQDGRNSVHYAVPLGVVMDAAGVASRARVAAGPNEGASGPRALVPDVPGLSLTIAPPEPALARHLAARSLLWLAVASCILALLFVHRALAREARAVAREKAFLAGVTHELRTPVAAIRVFGEALSEGSGNPREYGDLLVEESRRLEALVERTLATTRVDEAPRFAAVRPGELLDSAVALMRPAAERRGVALSVRAHADLGDAWWDAEAVRRALLNLIENAIKHGRPSGRVEADGRGEGAEVHLSVRDDGPGIARRDHRRLFGRFERGDTDVPGTGLGLYLVDQVARTHGGRVDLASRERPGCVFTLVLPRRPPALVPGGVEPAT